MLNIDFLFFQDISFTDFVYKTRMVYYIFMIIFSLLYAIFSFAYIKNKRKYIYTLSYISAFSILFIFLFIIALLAINKKTHSIVIDNKLKHDRIEKSMKMIQLPKDFNEPFEIKVYDSKGKEIFAERYNPTKDNEKKEKTLRLKKEDEETKNNKEDTTNEK